MITCAEQQGQTIHTMVLALTDGFIDAKVKRLDVTTALYGVAYDLTGLALIDQMSERSIKAIRDMLVTATDVVIDAPDQAAAIIHAAMAGAVRVVLSKTIDSMDVEKLRHHTRHLVMGYLGSLVTSPE